MAKTFEITRADGRSNTQVILDLVQAVTPGHVFGYEDLAAALAVETDRVYDVPAIRRVVQGAFLRLLREQQRALTNVRGCGYRVAFAGEHRQMAIVRTKRADTQFKRGYDTLRFVDFNALSDVDRRAHEGTLLIVGALFQQQQAMEKRLRSVEDAIRGLKT